MRAKRVRGQDVRARRHFVPVHRLYELGILDERAGAPERQRRIRIAPLDLRAHRGVQQQGLAGTQTLSKPFRENTHTSSVAEVSEP